MIVRGTTPGRRRNQQLNGGVPKGWRDLTPIRSEAAPGAPEPTELYAIISTWYDGDIIGAAVENCFQLGCSRVYILDNASPDDSVVRAKEAGAIVAKVYETEQYDDDYRIQLQNEIISTVTHGEQLPNLWWLALDADEFPAVEPDRTLKDKLSELPSEVDCVGSCFIDVYPTEPNQYIPGAHPAKCMTKGMYRRGNVRGLKDTCCHWKHQLTRHRDGNYHIALTRGNHRPASIAKSKIYEADWTLHVFHAPYRQEAHTRARLQALCGDGRNKWDDDVTRGNGAVRRWRSLDALYGGRWREVELAHTQVFGRPIVGLPRYEWRALVRRYAPELIGLFDVSPKALIDAQYNAGLSAARQSVYPRPPGQ